MQEGFPSITKEKSLQQSSNKSRNSSNFIECHNSPFKTVITIKSSRFDLTILIIKKGRWWTLPTPGQVIKRPRRKGRKPLLLNTVYHLLNFMSKKIILVLVGIFVPIFTIWNVYDFCASGSRSTAFSIGAKKKPLRCYGRQGSQCPRIPHKRVVAIWLVYVMPVLLSSRKKSLCPTGQGTQGKENGMWESKY